MRRLACVVLGWGLASDERRRARADPADPRAHPRAGARRCPCCSGAARGHAAGAARHRRAGRGLHLGARGQRRIHRRAHRRRRAPLPRYRAAAVLRRAREFRRHARVLLAHARPHRRDGLHEDGGGPRLPRLLRRADAALGPLGLGGGARLAERPLRTGRARPSATPRACSARTTRSS